MYSRVRMRVYMCLDLCTFMQKICKRTHNKKEYTSKNETKQRKEKYPTTKKTNKLFNNKQTNNEQTQTNNPSKTNKTSFCYCLISHTPDRLKVVNIIY